MSAWVRGVAFARVLLALNARERGMMISPGEGVRVKPVNNYRHAPVIINLNLTVPYRRLYCVEFVVMPHCITAYNIILPTVSVYPGGFEGVRGGSDKPPFRLGTP